MVEILSWDGEVELQDFMVEVKSVNESQEDVTKMSTPQFAV